MRIKTLIIFSLTIIISSCNFNKSVNKDMITGMTTRGDGLSVDRTYLSVNDEESGETTLTYGETLMVNFNNIEGFKKEDGVVFPGMELAVLNSQGDTIIYREDVYSDRKGISHSPLLLTSRITVANPMRSNESYELNIRIWDKKGEGNFTAQLNFEIAPDGNIETSGHGFTTDEIYLFDTESRSVITDGHVDFEKRILMFFENLEGFTTVDGKAHLGMKMKAEDAQGQLIFENQDLFDNQPIAVQQIREQLAASIIFSHGNLSNPVTWQVEIWDKDGSAIMSVETEIIVE